MSPKPLVERTRPPMRFVSTPELLALIKPLKLTPLDVAELTHVYIYRQKRGGHQSSTAGRWLSGKGEMPWRVFELLAGKLWFVRHRYATLAQVKTQTLVESLDHLEGKMTRLRFALIRYGDHDEQCPANADPQDPSKCTCGLSEAIGRSP
jgi:hypothetical protein